MRRLLVVNGHPDPRPARYCAALADAYGRGAEKAGWQARSAAVGELPLAALSRLADGDEPDAQAGEMMAAIDAADRLAIVFPLWFDKPPEPLTTLFARVAPRRAHIIVTMDMPAFAYRSMLRGPDASPLFAIPGISADEPVLIGCVSSISASQRRAWLRTMRQYGETTRLGSVPVPSRLEAFADLFDRKVAGLFA